MFSLNRAAHVPCLLVAGLLCLASALPVVAQTAHEHEHTGPAVANLQLDGGQKWQTDAALPGYTAVVAANDDRVARCLCVTLANNSKLYYVGYVSINKTPTLEVNTLMRLAGSVRFLNEPTRYAS